MLKKLFRLLLGFMIIAIGIQMMIQSRLGLNPWGILHTGLSQVLGISFGQATQLTGLVVILMALFFKIKPAVATLLNMILIGLFIDLVAQLAFLPIPNDMVMRIIQLLLGNVIFSIGIYLYLSTQWGAGPRDGLMLGLMRHFNQPTKVVRTALELTVMIIGISLGGKIGIGTLLIALTGGFTLHQVFRFFSYDPLTSKGEA